MDSGSGCTTDFATCVQDFGHVCGDVAVVATCVDGEWSCPSGFTPESAAECWCYGGVVGCECTPSGWDCPGIDAGSPDAGGCPSDWFAAEGTACSPEGMTCGSCTDPCGFCNLLRCDGGVWSHLEAFPPPPPCTSFECGPDMRCDAVTTYCSHAVSDIGGEPDVYRCEPYPEGCTSCSCLGGNACSGTSETGITVTWFGG
jgi:hypothetical protein